MIHNNIFHEIIWKSLKSQIFNWEYQELRSEVSYYCSEYKKNNSMVSKSNKNSHIMNQIHIKFIIIIKLVQ